MPAFNLDAWVARSGALDPSAVLWEDAPRHLMGPEKIGTLRLSPSRSIGSSSTSHASSCSVSSRRRPAAGSRSRCRRGTPRGAPSRGPDDPTAPGLLRAPSRSVDGPEYRAQLQRERRTQWPRPPLSTTAPTLPSPSPAPSATPRRSCSAACTGASSGSSRRVLESSGYQARILPVATKEDLLTGREVADIGQCCPTSFTTGNLVNFLKKEAKATSAAEVNKQVRLPHRRLLRRLPLRPVPPELRAGAAQHRARRVPHVPPGPGQPRPEGRWATASTSTCR